MGQGLQGQVAFITGAGGRRGIGRATALRLAQDGADIVLLDIPWPREQRADDEREDWDGVASVAAEVQALGRRALALHADVTDEGQVEGAVRQALDAFGRLDLLVANAAARPGGDRAPVVDLPLHELQRVLSVNLVGTFLCCKAVGRHLAQARRGAVVIVSSQSGRVGKPRMAAYCASKFGQVGLTQAFAHEMAAFGVRVNAVAPGPIDTARLDWSAQGARDQLLARQAAEAPLGRVGTAEEVADVIAFLCSDASRHMTGQVLGVDGGSRM